MPYELDIKVEKDFVYARATGERTKDSLSAMAREILEACRQHQISKVIVDIRKMRGRLQFFDSLSIVFDDFPELKRAAVFTKAAIVDSEIRRVRFTFIERVAVRRGYNLRFFSDPDVAIEWISEDA